MPGRILIIDPVEINRIALNVKLSRACYDVQLAASLRDGVRMLRAAHRFSPYTHLYPMFEPLWDYPPFQELLRPKG